MNFTAEEIKFLEDNGLYFTEDGKYYKYDPFNGDILVNKKDDNRFTIYFYITDCYLYYFDDEQISEGDKVFEDLTWDEVKIRI